MYLSRLTFHTLPGKTLEAEEKLTTLLHWVENAGGLRPRVMRTHFVSLGAAELIFEHEVEDARTLALQIKQVTENREFQRWAKQLSALLKLSSKREFYQIASSGSRVLSLEAAA
jgi:hypothetical protein